MAKLLAFCKKADARIDKRRGYRSAYCTGLLMLLRDQGYCEVGYRACCGAKDPTHKDHGEWVKLLKLMRRLGVQLSERPVKHDNGWATKAGGFWNSTIYELKNSG